MPKKKVSRKVPQKACGGCSKKMPATASKCPHCGYSKSSDKTLAIVGLILNMLVWPGLGTIVGGNTKIGVLQMLLIVVSIPLIFILIGIPMIFGIWVWAIISSIQQIKDSD